MSKAAEKEKNKGNDEFRKGNYAAAIEHYTYATEMDPRNFKFYTNRAACYEKMGKYEKALRDANKALKLNGDWDKGYWRGGNALLALGRAEEAMKFYEKAVAIAPDKNYGVYLDQATKAFFKDKSAADIKKNEGNALFKKGKIEEAVKVYTTALRLCGSDAKEQAVKVAILANRAHCYRQLYNHKGCIKDCDMALTIDPMNVKCYIRRAQARESIEKYDLALEDFDAANRLAPGMEVAYKGANRVRNAIRAMKKAGESY